MTRLYSAQFTEDTSLIDELRDECYRANNIILDKYGSDKQFYAVDKDTPITTGLLGSYNIFLFPFPRIGELYHSIRDHFLYGCRQKLETKYYIRGWLNMSNKGECIGWHKHWHVGESWHGFACIDVKNSVTYYQWENPSEFEMVEGRDGLMVIGTTSDNQHRTMPWLHESPRITIAFDIHPVESIQNMIYDKPQYWAPL